MPASPLETLDTSVLELRLQPEHGPFVRTLGHVVTVLGEIPDSPPQGFATADMVRLRELAEETIDAIERRMEAGADDEAAQQRLAGTIYEIRRRMEAIELWFRRRESA